MFEAIAPVPLAPVRSGNVTADRLLHFDATRNSTKNAFVCIECVSARACSRAKCATKKCSRVNDRSPRGACPPPRSRCARFTIRWLNAWPKRSPSSPAIRAVPPWPINQRTQPWPSDQQRHPQVNETKRFDSTRCNGTSRSSSSSPNGNTGPHLNNTAGCWPRTTSDHHRWSVHSSIISLLFKRFSFRNR